MFLTPRPELHGLRAPAERQLRRREAVGIALFDHALTRSETAPAGQAKNMYRPVCALLTLLLAACATVRAEDLKSWENVPVRISTNIRFF